MLLRWFLPWFGWSTGNVVEAGHLLGVHRETCCSREAGASLNVYTSTRFQTLVWAGKWWVGCTYAAVRRQGREPGPLQPLN